MTPAGLPGNPPSCNSLENEQIAVVCLNCIRYSKSYIRKEKALILKGLSSERYKNIYRCCLNPILPIPHSRILSQEVRTRRRSWYLYFYENSDDHSGLGSDQEKN